MCANFISFEYLPRGGTAGSCGSYFRFLKNLMLFSTAAVLTHIPSNSVGVPFAPQPRQQVSLLVAAV
jgi:hypothetical protein